MRKKRVEELDEPVDLQLQLVNIQYDTDDLMRELQQLAEEPDTASNLRSALENATHGLEHLIAVISGHLPEDLTALNSLNVERKIMRLQAANRAVREK